MVKKNTPKLDQSMELKKLLDGKYISKYLIKPRKHKRVINYTTWNIKIWHEKATISENQRINRENTWNSHNSITVY